MSAQTAGAYLQGLREQRGLSRRKVAQALNTNETQIERIDYGSNRVNGELLLSYIRYLGASVRHVTHLMLDVPASPADDLDHLLAQVDALSPERRQLVAALIRDLLRAEGSS
jgi:transcriptional regulator with XRE-family HTH domain